MFALLIPNTTAICCIAYTTELIQSYIFKIYGGLCNISQQQSMYDHLGIACIYCIADEKNKYSNVLIKIF